MQEDITGICKFLLERAKQELQIAGSIGKFYFIMRYPDIIKPVYYPLKVGDVFRPSVLAKAHEEIQAAWDKRLLENPSGAKLLAVYFISNSLVRIGNTGLYRPTLSGRIFLPGQMNEYQMYYNYKSAAIIEFENMVYMENRQAPPEFTVHPFPKNA